MDVISLQDQSVAGDFEAALAAARALAREQSASAMMLSWADRARNIVSPEVPECAPGDPDWLAYAKNRGGNLMVDINDGAYQFVFLV